MKIDVKGMTFEELINGICSLQKELRRRGTVTHCFNVAYTGNQETIYIKKLNELQEELQDEN